MVLNQSLPGGGEEEERDEVITIEDCKVGDWVEVKSGRVEPWRGQISVVDKTKAQPIGVKWLGRCTARRKNTPECLRCKEDNLFCFSKTCSKRCSVTTLRGPPPPAPAPAALASALSPAPAATGGKHSVPNNSEKKKRKYNKSGGGGEVKKCFVWEENVTADCHPSDVLVPFTYIKDRIYSLDGNGKGEYVVERRCEGRCNYTKGTAPYHEERLGEIQDLHAGANGTCPYQALQGGRILFRLHIFQDTVGKGFGIRTKQFIPKGGLVCEYVGEVITQVEATRRERSYSQLGLFYLHDIHGKGRYTKDDSFTIDPTIYGNVARMLNHSCEPNVTTLEVTVARDNNTAGEEDETDTIPRVPRVGFFAIRDIQANEELCIDYSPGRHGDELQRVIQCFCGLPTCKGWLF